MMGFLKAMKTIMMLNICSELPDMYIMMPVPGGQAFDGAQGHLPRLLELEGIHLFRGWGRRAGTAALLCRASFLCARVRSANVDVPRMEWRGWISGQTVP